MNVQACSSKDHTVDDARGLLEWNIHGGATQLVDVRVLPSLARLHAATAFFWRTTCSYLFEPSVLLATTTH